MLLVFGMKHEFAVERMRYERPGPSVIVSHRDCTNQYGAGIDPEHFLDHACGLDGGHDLRTAQRAAAGQLVSETSYLPDVASELRWAVMGMSLRVARPLAQTTVPWPSARRHRDQK